ncbi:MAG: putative baseplate assembly protein [Rhodothermaceae bacterium]|nr:MAG: putative baseplate assembly protein [Rhodothermaceae bacterium]
MPLPYTCRTPRRRNLTDATALNGIDYLEVLDAEAPAGSPRQRTLLVRLLEPVPADLTAGNLRITGGVRVAHVGVEWARAADDAEAAFAEGLLNEAERDFLLARPDPDHLLVVRTDTEGDHSTYTLSIVTSPTSDVPRPDFDPVLSETPFSFKIDCPSEFDCAPVQACPPEPPSAPPLDYLARDYGTFRRLLLDRLSVTLPEWTERNPADLGIALVEVLAYTGDYLSYQQDAVATEAYLGTARRRPSVRRHARLLDYAMHDGVNARAWVCLEVDAGGDGLVLAPEDATGFRTRLLTRMPEPVVLDPGTWETARALHRPEVFELLTGTTLYAAHNTIRLYTWSDEACCLPAGATRATLRDDETARLRLRPGDVLLFEEVRGAATGLEADADPARRHAVRLTRTVPEAGVAPDGTRTPGPLTRDPVTDEPVVEVEWAAGDALPFSLCLSARIGDRYEEDLTVARGNVVLADAGRSIAAEALPLPEAAARYRPKLAERGLTYRVPFDAAAAAARPAAEAVRQEPRAALPAVTLTGGGLTWTPRRDLLASGRFAAEFVVEMEDDGTARLRFGDGVYGRRPEAGLALTATYRVGNGPDGNVGAEALAHVVTAAGGISRVRNPLPATGGTAPETPAQVKLYAPQAFRIQERAVTEADYADVARRHPEVQKAVARRRWTGSWFTLFLAVDRTGGRPVDAAFEADLRAFLERFRLAGQDLEIDGPRFVPLDVAFTVCVAPGFFRADVKTALLDALSARDLPDGRRGFFHPDHFTFGQPVYLSRLLATAMAVPGVQWIDAEVHPAKPHRFQRRGQPYHGEYEQGFIDMGRLEIARLDNDPNRPENGKIELFMQGGL